ncbi:MAG: phenylalanine--tRNA ligase subunit beta [Nitrospirae bacterium]|nr:MAG: phenylalanine--tRNA ligase subunit beta [Nitrospirota bacterium]
MRVPFEWLNEIAPVTQTPEEVAHNLTMIGFEVEAIDRTGDDAVFEVNVTPNRPDCLSVIGLAREISAFYGIPVEFPEHDVLAEIGGLDFNVDILDKNLCNRYAGRIVRDVKIGESPEWMKKRLEKCGIRSINNVVDVTNYVLLEFGHPLHAFDLSTLKGNRIRIATPANLKTSGVRFKTLDGVEHAIENDMLLIWDEEKPVAVAGIMGGMDTEVKNSTTDIFIESAYFDPVSVRKTSKQLGIKTESSYRFERGTDIKILKKALDRAAYLMKEVAGGSIYGKIDIYPKRYVAPKISLTFERINKILGLRLAKKDILDCLNRLGLEIKEAGNGFTVKPPTYRRDVQNECDIIEEVARIYGYDRIPAQLPEAVVGSAPHNIPEKSKTPQTRKTVKDALLKFGFSEAINYSFMSAQDLDTLSIGSDDIRRNTIAILNPIRTEDSDMRTTLIPAMLKNLMSNLAFGSKELRLFEISKTFIRVPDASLPEEKEHAAGVLYQERSKTLYTDETHVFYSVKGFIEAVLREMRIKNYSFIRSAEPFLHPGQSADIIIGSGAAAVNAGFIGAAHPALVRNLGIKANKPSLVLFELNVDALSAASEGDLTYRPLPKFPFIERDTAVVVDNDLEASALASMLKEFKSDLIEDVSIFDVYTGTNIPEGKKSIAFNVRYRAADRTLKDEEADTLHNSLVEHILKKTKGQLRQ